jgi:nucleoside-diphosphate-sugar epimerase
MSRRVLITGGLGFIGSHLADAYAARGWRVTALDDLSANVVQNDHQTVSTFWHLDAAHISPFVVAGHDLVVHAASPVGAAGILGVAGRIVGRIVATTQAVVDACIETGVPLVSISTSEVYGRTGRSSETDPLQVPAHYSPRLEYAVGKAAAEQTVGVAAQHRGLRAVQIRPWNVVGPREAASKGFVLPRFCDQAMRGKPLTVFGRGSQERALTGVWDLARFICDHLPDQREWHGQPYNVGAESNRTSMLALAHRVRIALGSSSEVVFTDGRAVFGPLFEEAAGTTKLPDARRAAALGWAPEYDLDRIIHATAIDIARPVAEAA